jgi:hypothetical protein
MTRLPFLLVLTLIAFAPAGWTQSGEPTAAGEETCSAGASCPQTYPGWMLYLDPNRVPDFWWKGTVSIREISICPHGIHFLFVEEQAGQDFLMALILKKPSKGMVERKLKIRGDGTPVREALDRDLKSFYLLIEELRRISDGALSGTSQMSFLGAVAGEWPKLVPWRLTLRWRGVELEMTGYLDLYINMLT